MSKVSGVKLIGKFFGINVMFKKYLLQVDK